MGDKSKIEWTEASWTPIRARNKATGKIGWHCEHATPACEFCYAESMNKRLGTGLPFKPGHRKDIEIFLDEKMLTQPLRWSRGRMIFVCSMTDLFADFVPDEWIDRVFAVMGLAAGHTFQVLTKRAERMHSYMKDRFGKTSIICDTACKMDNIGVIWASTLADQMHKAGHFRNVWLGVSAEDQKRADERIPHLLHTPAAVRFVSAEPLLGPINFGNIRESAHAGFEALAGLWVGPDDEHRLCNGLDWIIVGGESGPNARPMHPGWARSIRDQCQAAGVPFFFKQWGEHAPNGSGRYSMIKVGKHAAGRLLNSREHNEMPERAI